MGLALLFSYILNCYIYLYKYFYIDHSLYSETYPWLWGWVAWTGLCPNCLQLTPSKENLLGRALSRVMIKPRGKPGRELDHLASYNLHCCTNSSILNLSTCSSMLSFVQKTEQRHCCLVLVTTSSRACCEERLCDQLQICLWNV